MKQKQMKLKTACGQIKIFLKKKMKTNKIQNKTSFPRTQIKQ